LKRKTLSKVEYFGKQWDEFLRFFVSFAFDTARTALIILVLDLFRWLLKLSEATGLETEYAIVLEKLHFWASFALLAILSIDFIVKLLRTTLLGRQE
jgi:hypothetical protein